MAAGDFDVMLARASAVDSDTDEDWEEEGEAEPGVSRRGRPSRQTSEPGENGWYWAQPRGRSNKVIPGWTTSGDLEPHYDWT